MKLQGAFSRSTEMQSFLETAKGACTTLQEVIHNPHAEDLPLTHNGTKQTCHQVHSCYLLKGKRGELWSAEGNP